MKKLIAILILMCITLSFTSCASKKPPIFTEEDEEIYDFRGSTFTVLTTGFVSNNGGLNDRNIEGRLCYNQKRGTSSVTDALMDRYSELTKKYNINFDFENENSLQSEILTMSITGKSGADLIYTNSQTVFGLYGAGLLDSLEDIPLDDLESDKWGEDSYMPLVTFGGKRYGFTPNYWPFLPAAYGLLLINMSLAVDKFGMTDPHEYIEDKSWNWENLKTELRKVTNDGDVSYTAMLGGFAPDMVIANGGYIIKNINGRYQSGFNTDNFTEAMEFARSLNEEGLMRNASGIGYDLFMVGEQFVMMNGDSPHIATSDNVYISTVSFPYGPHGSPESLSGFTWFEFFYAVPVTRIFSEDELAFILEETYEPLTNYEDGWRGYAEDNYFNYQSDYEMYAETVDNIVVYPFGILSESFDAMEKEFNTYIGGGGSLSAAIQTIEDLLNNEINEKLNG